MSTLTSIPPAAAVAAPPGAGTPAISAPCRADVIVDNRIIIPGWINTLEEYRRWAESDEYPQSGQISYLDRAIWVDSNMEEFLTHNQIKQAFNFMFGSFLAPHPIGRFVP